MKRTNTSYNINSFRIDIENFNTTYENPIIDPYVTDDRKTNNSNFDVGALYRFRNFYPTMLLIEALYNSTMISH